MTSQERIDRADALYQLQNHLPGEDFGEQATCAQLDPDTGKPAYDLELFFPISEEHTHQIARAKSVCRSCPVQGSCLQFALAHGERGIWGGTTEEERRKIRLLRRQGRNETAETGGQKRGEAA